MTSGQAFFLILVWIDDYINQWKEGRCQTLTDSDVFDLLRFGNGRVNSRTVLSCHPSVRQHVKAHDIQMHVHVKCDAVTWEIFVVLRLCGACTYVCIFACVGAHRWGCVYLPVEIQGWPWVSCVFKFPSKPSNSSTASQVAMEIQSLPTTRWHFRWLVTYNYFTSQGNIKRQNIRKQTKHEDSGLGKQLQTLNWSHLASGSETDDVVEKPGIGSFQRHRKNLAFSTVQGMDCVLDVWHLQLSNDISKKEPLSHTRASCFKQQRSLASFLVSFAPWWRKRKFVLFVFSPCRSTFLYVWKHPCLLITFENRLDCI